MKMAIAVLALAAAASVACERRAGTAGEAETAREGGAATDTIVTERSMQDTAVVTTDTTVSVDTSMRRGEGAAAKGRDTVRDTRDRNAARDTTRP